MTRQAKHELLRLELGQSALPHAGEVAPAPDADGRRDASESLSTDQVAVGFFETKLCCLDQRRLWTALGLASPSWLCRRATALTAFQMVRRYLLQLALPATVHTHAGRHDRGPDAACLAPMRRIAQSGGLHWHHQEHQPCQRIAQW